MPHRSGVPAPRTRAAEVIGDTGTPSGRNGPTGGCLAPAWERRAAANRIPRTGDVPQGILSWLSPRRCLTVRDVPGRVPMELPCLQPRQGRGMRNGPDNALRYEDTPLCRASPVTAEPWAV